VLDAYNFCPSCNAPVPVPPEQETYSSYWEAVYYLLGIFLLFRVMVVISLAIQDAKFKDATGDTRNQNLQTNSRDKTMLVVAGRTN